MVAVTAGTASAGLVLLRLLFEEFSDARGDVPSARVAELRTHIQSHVTQIRQLLFQVLQQCLAGGGGDWKPDHANMALQVSRWPRGSMDLHYKFIDPSFSTLPIHPYCLAYIS